MISYATPRLWATILLFTMAVAHVAAGRDPHSMTETFGTKMGMRITRTIPGRTMLGCLAWDASYGGITGGHYGMGEEGGSTR